MSRVVVTNIYQILETAASEANMGIAGDIPRLRYQAQAMRALAAGTEIVAVVKDGALVFWRGRVSGKHRNGRTKIVAEDCTAEIAPSVRQAIADKHLVERRATARHVKGFKQREQDSFERARTSQKPTAEAELRRAEISAGLAASLIEPEKTKDQAEVRKQGRVQPDTLTLMRSRGHLIAEQIQAAEEIFDVFMWITGRLMSKAANLDEDRAGQGASQPGDGGKLVDAWACRYKPWADRLSGATFHPVTMDEMRRIFPRTSEDALTDAFGKVAAPEKHKPNPAALQIVIEVVIDGRSLDEIRKDRHWRSGVANGLLKEGLMLYAEMAGWLKRKVNRHAA